MLYMNYLIFIGLGILFLLIALWKEKNVFWNVAGSFISSVFWLVISLGQMELDFPYQLLGQDVICGYCTYTDPLSPYFVYLFFGLFVVLQIYVWVMVFDLWYTKQMVNVDDGTG